MVSATRVIIEAHRLAARRWGARTALELGRWEGRWHAEAGGATFIARKGQGPGAALLGLLCMLRDRSAS